MRAPLRERESNGALEVRKSVGRPAAFARAFHELEERRPVRPDARPFVEVLPRVTSGLTRMCCLARITAGAVVPEDFRGEGYDGAAAAALS